MEDAIVRHWSTSNEHATIEGFQAYQTFNKTEFYELSKRLDEALDAHQVEHAEAGDKRFGLFAYQARTQSVAALRQRIADLGLNGDAEPEMTAANIQAFQNLLTESKEHLPGHLITLTKELLARSDSLTQHLQAKEARVLAAMFR